MKTIYFPCHDMASLLSNILWFERVHIVPMMMTILMLDATSWWLNKVLHVQQRAILRWLRISYERVCWAVTACTLLIWVVFWAGFQWNCKRLTWTWRKKVLLSGEGEIKVNSSSLIFWGSMLTAYRHLAVSSYSQVFLKPMVLWGKSSVSLLW